MTEAATKLDVCQVRSGTKDPCAGLAVVEVFGVPFCERHAREQESYFAIGELTRVREPDDRGWRDASRGTGPLAEALGRVRRGLTRKVARASALVGSSQR